MADFNSFSGIFAIAGSALTAQSERMNVADNAMRYEANLTLLGARIKSLLAAAQ